MKRPRRDAGESADCLGSASRIISQYDLRDMRALEAAFAGMFAVLSLLAVMGV